MDAAALAIWLIALILLVFSFFPPGKLYLQGLKKALEYFIVMFPRLTMAILVSGLFSAIVPTDLVAAWLGKGAGLKGILIGSLVGGFIPGGPIICFPVVIILFKNGAALPALVAFVTAWSVFAFHRIIAYELPLMGYRFVMVRLLSSLALPPLAGMLTALIEEYLPVSILDVFH